MSYPKKVKIVEVGPRDGLQNERKTLSVEDRVQLINALSDSGLKVIEVGSFVSPKWIPQMADSDLVFKRIQKKETVSYPVLVPNEVGFERALELGVQEISVFTASSETFCQKNINCSIEESFQRFDPVIQRALKGGIKIRGYISCVMGCPYEGDVPFQKSLDVTKRLFEMGCYEISLGDTIGIGTPNKVKVFLDLILQNIPSQSLAVHFHDTYGQALANILQSLQVGIQTIDASLAGLGGCPYASGASGNVATEDVLYMLQGMEIGTGVDLQKIAEVGNETCQKLGQQTRSKAAQALLGRPSHEGR